MNTDSSWRFVVARFTSRLSNHEMYKTSFFLLANKHRIHASFELIFLAGLWNLTKYAASTEMLHRQISNHRRRSTIVVRIQMTTGVITLRYQVRGNAVRLIDILINRIGISARIKIKVITLTGFGVSKEPGLRAHFYMPFSADIQSRRRGYLKAIMLSSRHIS